MAGQLETSPDSDLGPQGLSAAARAKQVANAKATADASSPAGNKPNAATPLPNALNPSLITAKRIAPYSASMQKTANRGQAVGGPVKFTIGILKMESGKPAIDKSFPLMVFEMAPARRSFMDKQGQMVPGAGAGLCIKTRFNVARIPIPGGKPALHNMGVAEEILEWVGAFVGLDHYFDTRENEPTKKRVSGPEEARELFRQFKLKREVILTLNFTDNNSVHAIEFDAGVNFTGYIDNIKLVEATEQKTYYQLSLVVTNRDHNLILDSEPPVSFPSTETDFASIVSLAPSPNGIIGPVNTLDLSSVTPADIKAPNGVTAAQHEAFVNNLVALKDKPIRVTEGVDRQSAKTVSDQNAANYSRDYQDANAFLGAHPEYLKDQKVISLRNIADNRMQSYFDDNGIKGGDVKKYLDRTKR